MGRILSLVLLAVFCVGCHAKRTGPTAPVNVNAFQVEEQNLPADFTFVGVAKSSHPVEIRSRVEGYLIKIAYTEGSYVKAGDLLFQIDPRPFEASLASAKGELARQEAVLWRAKEALDRIAPLFEKNAVSKRDLDNATAEVLTAEASVIMAKANVVQAELNLSYTHITSPIDAYSGRALYREGTLITPSINGLLTYVSVIDPIWVYFSVSDLELLQGRAEAGSKQLILPKQQDYKVYLTLADGTTFPEVGTVNFAAPILDPQTGTMTVRATFANPKGELVPGQFVQATVKGAIRPNALSVPQQAVFQGQKGQYVFVIGSDNTVTAREVSVGAWYKNFWIITGGLKEGELIVADGVNKVQTGTHVQIRSLVKTQVATYRRQLHFGPDNDEPRVSPLGEERSEAGSWSKRMAGGERSQLGFEGAQ